MTHDEPLDLRSLSAVESPELVSAAIRRFRRRLFSTGAVVLLAAVSLVGGIVWAIVMDRGLEERIEDSRGRNVGAVYEPSGVTVVLTRVAEVDSGVGLGFVLAGVTKDHGDLFLRIDGIRESDEYGDSGAREAYLVVGPPRDGQIDATLMQRHGCDPDPGVCRTRPESLGTFTIDLEQLRVPEELWKESRP